MDNLQISQYRKLNLTGNERFYWFPSKIISSARVLPDIHTFNSPSHDIFKIFKHNKITNALDFFKNHQIGYADNSEYEFGIYANNFYFIKSESNFNKIVNFDSESMSFEVSWTNRPHKYTYVNSSQVKLSSLKNEDYVIEKFDNFPLTIYDYADNKNSYISKYLLHLGDFNSDFTNIDNFYFLLAYVWFYLGNKCCMKDWVNAFVIRHNFSNNLDLNNFNVDSKFFEFVSKFKICDKEIEFTQMCLCVKFTSHDTNVPLLTIIMIPNILHNCDWSFKHACYEDLEKRGLHNFFNVYRYRKHDSYKQEGFIFDINSTWRERIFFENTYHISRSYGTSDCKFWYSFNLLTDLEDLNEKPKFENVICKDGKIISLKVKPLIGKMNDCQKLMLLSGFKLKSNFLVNAYMQYLYCYKEKSIPAFVKKKSQEFDNQMSKWTYVKNEDIEKAKEFFLKVLISFLYIFFS